MAGDNHGTETQEVGETAQDNRHEQAQENQPQVSGTDWEKAVAERDEKIAALEAQVVEAARNAEIAEKLRGEIAELKAQGESDRIDFKLQLAGVRNSGRRMVRAGHNAKLFQLPIIPSLCIRALLAAVGRLKVAARLGITLLT